jgi:hypothetical protein
MCQEAHWRYACNDKHTKCMGVEKKCSLSWAPHGKIKMIRGYINGPCQDCARLLLVRPAQKTYTIVPTAPIVYTTAPASASVIVKPVPAIVVPAPQPEQIIIQRPPPTTSSHSPTTNSWPWIRRCGPQRPRWMGKSRSVGMDEEQKLLGVCELLPKEPSRYYHRKQAGIQYHPWSRSRTTATWMGSAA